MLSKFADASTVLTKHYAFIRARSFLTVPCERRGKSASESERASFHLSVKNVIYGKNQSYTSRSAVTVAER
jgi:hypothetical protein